MTHEHEHERGRTGGESTTGSSNVDECGDGRRRAARRRARLTASYLIALGLCALMVTWVGFAPGSRTTSQLVAVKRRYDDDFLGGSAAKYVPSTLITKYRAHPLVCAAHVLPSALWSALAPAQLHPGLRRRHPRVHRLSGRVFVSTALLMSGGYALIHRRNLHFHADDFPSLARGEALSLAAPELWGWLGGGWGRALASARARARGWPDAVDPPRGWSGGFSGPRGGRGRHPADGESTSGGGGGSGGGGDDDAALSAFLVFEHCAAAWFAATALMTWWSAWWGSRSAARLAKSVAAGGTDGGGGGGGGWIAAHRAWAVRHVAAGLSVAAQRVIIFAAHGVCDAVAAAARFDPSTDFDTSFCSSPASQKGIFADSLVVGTALCVVAAEVAVRDLRSAVVRGGPRGGGAGGAGAGALAGLPEKRD